MRRAHSTTVLSILGVLAFFGTVAAIILINVFGRNDLPTDPVERINALRNADLPAETVPIFQDLLQEFPNDVDLHYHYIETWFSIVPTEDVPRDDASLEAYYTTLTADPALSDFGYFGLGRFYWNVGDDAATLDALRNITIPNMKYLNFALGEVHFAVGNLEQAEQHLQREIELTGGFTRGATEALVTLYRQTGRISDIRALLESETTAPYVPFEAARIVAQEEGNIPEYLALTFIAPVAFVELIPGLSALVICLMWFLFFWRIDVFEQEPLLILGIALGLGVISAPITFILTDTLSSIYPLQLGVDWVGDLVYNIVFIGVLEEVAKFAMILVVVLLFRQVNEPIDLMIYGSMVALGFATIENALYFTSYGLGIVFTRFLISTVMHLSMTGIICYWWARAAYINKRGPVLTTLAVIRGLIVASVVHGLFDYFLISEFVQVPIVSIVIMIFTGMVYSRMLNNAINFSPHFHVTHLESRRLSNFGLLLLTGCALLLVVYLSNHVSFSTDIANAQLGSLWFSILLVGGVVFVSLSEINAIQGNLLPLVGDDKDKEADTDEAANATETVESA